MRIEDRTFVVTGAGSGIGSTSISPSAGDPGTIAGCGVMISVPFSDITGMPPPQSPPQPGEPQHGSGQQPETKSSVGRYGSQQGSPRIICQNFV